jgi:hypothetical protein
MKTISIALLFLTLSLLVPQVAFAQVCPTEDISNPLGANSDFTNFICFFVQIISSLVPLFAALTLLVFFLGLAKFILAAGDEKKTVEGKRLMFWGVIALFVMSSLWGLVQIISNVFFDGQSIGIPLLPQ